MQGFKLGHEEVEVCISWGTILTGTVRATDKKVALKRLHGRLREKEEHFMAELAQLKQQGQCNELVEYHGFFFQSHDFYIVMDFMDLGGLHSLVERVRANVGSCISPVVPLPHLQHISRSVARGLQFLHERGFCHQHMKPENILHSSDGNIRLSDAACFASLQELGVEDCVVRNQMRTAYYFAPERATGSETGPLEDIWGLGLVLHELATSEPPYGHPTSVLQLARCILEDPEPRLDAAVFPESLRDFHECCLTRELGKETLPCSEAAATNVGNLDSRCGNGSCCMEGPQCEPDGKKEQEHNCSANELTMHHVVVRTLRGEVLFGPASRELPWCASELEALALAAPGGARIGCCRLVVNGQVLEKAEQLRGGSIGTPLEVTLVADAARRASAADLLRHEFLSSSEASGTDPREIFRHWLQTLDQAPE